MSRLLEGNRYQYDRVQKWAKRVKSNTGASALDSDVVLLPIHLGVHWALAGFDVPARCLHYWDSLPLQKGDPLYIGQKQNACRQWLSDESAHKLGEGQRWDTGIWPIHHHPCGVPGGVPAQLNGIDCGMFMISFAQCILSGIKGFPLSQKDIPYLRRRLALDIHATKDNVGKLFASD